MPAVAAAEPDYWNSELAQSESIAADIVTAFVLAFTHTRVVLAAQPGARSTRCSVFDVWQ